MDRLEPIHNAAKACAVTDAVWFEIKRHFPAIPDSREQDVIAIVNAYRIERGVEVDKPTNRERSYANDVRHCANKLLALLNPHADATNAKVLPHFGESYALRSTCEDFSLLRRELGFLSEAAQYWQHPGKQPSSAKSKRRFVFEIASFLNAAHASRNEELLKCLLDISDQLSDFWEPTKPDSGTDYKLGSRKNIERFLTEWRK
ncbi:MAG TPA: hypothetical protein VMX97_13630, partial [Hyphomicrobiaceae bacterium]|nr:hypothetical protein [Hyphomicrobiaceae bacterium]